MNPTAHPCEEIKKKRNNNNKLHIFYSKQTFSHRIFVVRGFCYVAIIPRSSSENLNFITEPSCRICCQRCQTSRLQTASPLANEQSMHPVFATFSKMHFPFSVFQPTPFIPPPPFCNWTLNCRHANQALIHLKLTGRPDYGGGFLLQTSYHHHLSRNTCRNMKELPSSTSRSIVCRMWQQSEGKLSSTHLSPGV